MSLEERVSRIEGILGQMDKRISEFREDFNRRLNHLESDLKELRSEYVKLGAGCGGLLVS